MLFTPKKRFFAFKVTNRSGRKFIEQGDYAVSRDAKNAEIMRKKRENAEILQKLCGDCSGQKTLENFEGVKKNKKNGIKKRKSKLYFIEK